MSTPAKKPKVMETLEPGDCRWPIGDPRLPGFHFCGVRQAAGRPYCIEHWQLSFVPSRPRGSTGPVQQPASPAPAALTFTRAA